MKTAEFYGFSAKDIDGKDVPLSRFEGSVVLVVNTASECGFTPQYEGLEKIYRKYQAKGFQVLGFPTNDFGEQEPGSNEVIKNFCATRFSVSFPLFEKITVKGDSKHPLYQWLTGKSTNPGFSGAIKWNFNKFLIGRDGKVLARFESDVTPESAELLKALEAAL